MLGIIRNTPAQLLVVDDEPLVRDLLVRWLRDERYWCATASSPTAAWAHLQEHPVDLATMDITMPGGSRLDLLLDQIRQTLSDTAAIMLTAEGDTAKAIRALTAGVCECAFSTDIERTLQCSAYVIVRVPANAS
jgi:two-component system response regulator PilR (NtrC family)